jgi:hypothetical protein
MRNARPLATALCLFAASACGDDDPRATSGGGGGGGGDATSTTSSTTGGPASTSSPASSSASSGNGTGGSAGGGDTGGGGASSGSGGGGAASTACDEVAGDGAAIVVVTVDEAGDEVPVLRVAWQDEPADPFWLEPEEASCAGGVEPPCSVWEIADQPTGRIAITSERETEAEPTEECFPYASTFVEVHPSRSRQRVHLTLPTDGLFCIDGETGRSYVNVDHDEEVDEADCLAPPPDVSGRITLDVVDLEGEPVPATTANWYYHPESPEFDGEHPLACADQRCTRWIVTDTPAVGTIYLNASYAGPLNPFVQQGWSGYDGAPFEVEIGGDGQIVPLFAELALDTTLEGAIGGDAHD